APQDAHPGRGCTRAPARRGRRPAGRGAGGDRRAGGEGREPAGRRRRRRAGRPARPVREAPRPAGGRGRRAAARALRGMSPVAQHRRPRPHPGRPAGRGAPLRGMPPDPGPHPGLGPVTRRLVVEADGGSRGNPGPAGYGAVVRDAATGEVLAEVSESIGRATNNVAEYSGLIAGLRAAATIARGADVEVRMDSKLVVEQMSGRWQIKHPDMRPLAAKARETARALGRVSYTWVPRSRNAHADRLANQAMDAAARALAGDADPAGSTR